MEKVIDVRMIEIAGHHIEVKLLDQARDPDAANALAYYDEDTITITLKNTHGRVRSVANRMFLFFHEALHHIDRRFLGDILKERAISGIAEGLTQITLSNGLDAVKEMLSSYDEKAQKKRRRK